MYPNRGKAYYFIHLFGSIGLVNKTPERNVKYDFYPQETYELDEKKKNILEQLRIQGGLINDIHF